MASGNERLNVETSESVVIRVFSHSILFHFVMRGAVLMVKLRSLSPSSGSHERIVSPYHIPHVREKSHTVRKVEILRKQEAVSAARHRYEIQ